MSLRILFSYAYVICIAFCVGVFSLMHAGETTNIPLRFDGSCVLQIPMKPGFVEFSSIQHAIFMQTGVVSRLQNLKLGIMFKAYAYDMSPGRRYNISVQKGRLYHDSADYGAIATQELCRLATPECDDEFPHEMSFPDSPALKFTVKNQSVVLQDDKAGWSSRVQERFAEQVAKSQTLKFDSAGVVFTCSGCRRVIDGSKTLLESVCCGKGKGLEGYKDCNMIARAITVILPSDASELQRAIADYHRLLVSENDAAGDGSTLRELLSAQVLNLDKSGDSDDKLELYYAGVTKRVLSQMLLGVMHYCRNHHQQKSEEAIDGQTDMMPSPTPTALQGTTDCQGHRASSLSNVLRYTKEDNASMSALARPYERNQYVTYGSAALSGMSLCLFGYKMYQSYRALRNPLLAMPQRLDLYKSIARNGSYGMVCGAGLPMLLQTGHMMYQRFCRSE